MPESDTINADLSPETNEPVEVTGQDTTAGTFSLKPEDAPGAQAEGEEAPEATEKPEWLQDKYVTEGRSIEEAIAEQAKAYESAQKKLSERPEPAEPDASASGDWLTDIGQKWVDGGGEFTAEMYAEIEGKGFTKEQADGIANGWRAQAEQAQSELFSAIGGQEAFQSLATWEQDNLSPDEYKGLEGAWTKADSLDEQKVLLTQRMAVMQNKSPKHAQLLQGSTAGPSGGTKPFESQTEMMAAKRKADATNDPIEQSKWEQRMMASAHLFNLVEETNG